MNRKDFIAAMGLGSSALLAPGCGKAGEKNGDLPEFDPNNPSSFWRSVRSAYSLSPDRVYLNCGGLGPAPSVVTEAVAEKTRELQQISETGYAIMDVARTDAALYFGVGEDEICFTRNATESNSIVATGLELKRDDEVIFESHAHPGGSFPWLSRRKRDGIRIRIFDPDPNSMAESVDRIATLITDRTRVIQVSHITAPTGILFDVKAIAALAREKGIWFHLDGAQTAGMIPVDLKAIGCDSYATSGHKWMGGPRGTGILYIAKDRLEEVAAHHVGGHSAFEYELPDRIEYLPSARRHEYGTRNTALVEGLRVAIGFQNAIGKERIKAYGLKLASYLHQGLEAIDGVTVLTPSDPEMRGSITTFKARGIPFSELTSKLMRDYRLRCRQVSERELNAVRVSTHLYNSQSDCDRVLEAVREIVAGV